MATNRLEVAKADVEAEGERAEETPVSTPASGGLKPWLPFIANVVLMPVLAYVTMTFVLPRLRPSSERLAASEVEGSEKSAGASEEGKEGNGKSKFTIPLSGKVLVNVAGTMGTRYLLANVTLVSSNTDLKNAVEKNDAQLRDVASSVLAGKTIADLEKPGARNLIRTELISAFNNVMWNGGGNEIYLTE